MTDDQYIDVSAALTMQDFMLRTLWANMTFRHTAKGLEDMGRDLRNALMSMSLPEGVEPNETALAIQREALRQFDVFWSRVSRRD